MPVVEAFRHVGTDGNQYLNGRTLRHCLLYLPENIRLAHANDGLHGSRIVAINNVVTGKHVCCGNRNCTQFVQGKHRNPPLEATLLDEHHHVATLDTQASQVGSGLVAHPLKVIKGQLSLYPFIVCPQKGNLIWCHLCPSIHNIIGEVKVLGNNKLKVLRIIFLGNKGRLLQEAT